MPVASLGWSTPVPTLRSHATRRRPARMRMLTPNRMRTSEGGGGMTRRIYYLGLISLQAVGSIGCGQAAQVYTCPDPASPCTTGDAGTSTDAAPPIDVSCAGPCLPLLPDGLEGAKLLW